MRVVIAGGHGKIALLLERLLAGRGDQAVGLIRNPAQAADVQKAGAEAVICDLETASADDVVVLLSGADAVIFAAGEEALEQERDLPVPARDHHAHAASILTRDHRLVRRRRIGPSASRSSTSTRRSHLGEIPRDTRSRPGHHSYMTPRSTNLPGPPRRGEVTRQPGLTGKP